MFLLKILRPSCEPCPMRHCPLIWLLLLAVAGCGGPAGDNAPAAPAVGGSAETKTVGEKLTSFCIQEKQRSCEARLIVN